MMRIIVQEADGTEKAQYDLPGTIIPHGIVMNGRVYLRAEPTGSVLTYRESGISRAELTGPAWLMWVDERYKVKR